MESLVLGYKAKSAHLVLLKDNRLPEQARYAELVNSQCPHCKSGRRYKNLRLKRLLGRQT